MRIGELGCGGEEEGWLEVAREVELEVVGVVVGAFGMVGSRRGRIRLLQGRGVGCGKVVGEDIVGEGAEGEEEEERRWQEFGGRRLG